MFNLEKYIENSADNWASVSNRFTGEIVCDIAIVDDMGFVYDEDGYIGECFTIDSTIFSAATRSVISEIVNLDKSEVRIQYAN